MIAALRRPLIASGVAAVVALGLAGCGGSSTKTTTDPSGSDTAALQKFKSCLSEHGVKLPEHREGGPPSGGSGSGSGKPPSGGFRPGGGFGSSGDSKKMEEAFEDCSKYAPSFGHQGAGGEGHYPGAGGFRPGGSAGEGGSGEGGSGGGGSSS